MWGGERQERGIKGYVEKGEIIKIKEIVFN